MTSVMKPANLNPAMKGNMSVAERRRATLERTGIASNRKLASGPPPAAFYGILAFTILLVMFGLVMVLSASSVTMLHSGNSPLYMFNKQLFWATIGAFMMFFMYRTPYIIWKKWAPAIFAVGIFGMFLPFVPGWGVEVRGARAWVGTGVLGFQPSEFLKIAILLVCAKVLAERFREVDNLRRTFWPVMFFMLVASGLCVLQGDLGSAIVFAAIIFGVLFISGMRMSILVSAGAVMAVLGIMSVLPSDYRRQRWTSFLNLSETKGHLGYQVYQSMISIANGGLTGVGVGEGAGKWGYVPLAHSDFIFAIVAEEFGLLGVIAVLGMFLGLVLFGIQAALGARDVFGALIAGGITSWFAVQAFINVGGVTATMPVTGLTLPFISYGGSSLLVSMAAAGLLLNVARNMK
ncbi:MAG: putative lipid II flippase FtsW [Actinobacteria bacterium]|nr:putative lipid II flippase FtsW [Actinomycetota bacterium]NBP53558.1 putative lipid II flippase FtsW [Actinomycetota bacterium]